MPSKKGKTAKKLKVDNFFDEEIIQAKRKRFNNYDTLQLSSKDGKSSSSQDVKASSSQDVKASSSQDVKASSSQDVKALSSQDVKRMSLRLPIYLWKGYNKYKLKILSENDADVTFQDFITTLVIAKLREENCI